MLDTAFQAGTDTVLKDMAQRPRAPQVQAPKFSLWKTIDATARGAAAGLNQVVGSAADVMGAFGEITAAAQPDMMGFVPDQKERQRQVDAARKMQRQGPDGMSPIGASFRNVAESYMPDPTTAHASEVVVADFFRVATKAVGAALTLGPLGGAAAAGAEEGFSQSDKLAREGVDLATRSKVGAVTGAVTAAGLALPVAGRTWAQTVGLAVAGGPASFVAQNAANRAILEAADYTKQAEQFDPFDPVGLALSTVLPLGFGAAAMRSSARAARAAEQRATIPPEVEDAARANVLRENLEAHRPAPVQDLAAAGRHEQAVARALDQVSTGSRVDVTDLVPAEVLQQAQVLDRFITQVEDVRATLIAEAGNLAEPGAIRLVREELALMEQQRPDTSEAGIKALAKQIQANEGVSYKTALSQAKKQTAAVAADFDARVARLEDAIATNAEAEQSRQALAVVDRQLGELQARRAEIDAPPTAPNPVAAAVQELITRQPQTLAAQVLRALEGAPPALLQASEVAPGAAAKAGNSEAPAAGQAQPAGQSAAKADDPTFAGMERAVAELEALSPDLPVQLDGMAGPVPLRELMAMMREEVQADLADVPLLEAAATCFIRTGAAAA